MKKILFSMLAIAALSIGFVSCGDDDEETTYTTTAEAGSAGTYTGTWTSVTDDATTTYDGTVTLAAAADKAGCTNVTFDCSGASLNKTAIANVWHSNNGYQFVNQVDKNDLGAAFSGRVSDDGQLTTAFTIKQKIGRKEVKVNYSFTGKKQ